MSRKLCIDALRMAVMTDGLVHQSDRGSHYASADHQGMLEEYEMICSMSRRADCWDNAPMESF